MKLRLLLASIVVFTGASVAQPATSAEADSGLVKAGGLAYGLDVAFDNALETAALLKMRYGSRMSGF